MNENIKDSFISVEKPKSNFKEFLDQEGNKRIFFSGIFGSGKTWFLKKFFEDLKNSYDIYHLFPINYQINSNENMFELLKYDILVELLNKDPKVFEKIESKQSKKEPIAISETMWGILSLYPNSKFQFFLKLGRRLSDFPENFETILRENTQKDSKEIENFTKETEGKKSNARDSVSYLLEKAIKKQKSEKRKSVLILDDFDRMDPEHIFRILNILSTHAENSGENEFGFNHIIIVGDKNNIKNIFHHKYGEKTDFGGYFDKFFSFSPYDFNNKEAVGEVIPRIMGEIKGMEKHTNIMFEMQPLLQDILLFALENEKLNLRQLYMPINFACINNSQLESMHPNFDLRNIGNKIKCLNLTIEILIKIFTDKKTLLEIIEKNFKELDNHEIEMKNIFFDYPFTLYNIKIFKNIDLSSYIKNGKLVKGFENKDNGEYYFVSTLTLEEKYSTYLKILWDYIKIEEYNKKVSMGE